MAGFFIHDCPHQHTKQISLQVEYYSRKSFDDDIYVLHCICRCCGNPVSFVVFAHTEESVAKIDAAMISGGRLPQDLEILKQFPAPQNDNIPDSLPSSIERNFRQALENTRLKNPDAASMTLRKSVELACKKLLGSSKKFTFDQSVKHLKDKQIIPETLAEWATEIRFFGNEGAHDDTPHTQEELEEAIEFADTLLQYLFSMPALLERRRNRKKETKQT